MKKIFFISDVHLGADSPAEEHKKKEKLLSFFRYIQQSGTRLFILGDLFDVWFEYRFAIPREYFYILRALYDLREAGIQIDFIVGNHDFWVDDFFPEELGIQTYRKPLSIELHSKKIFIAHGHGLLKSNIGDKILKKIFENQLNISLYRLLSPEIGIPLAKFISKWSRRNGFIHENPTEIILKYSELVKSLNQNANYDAYIMGHSHVPVLKQLGNTIYLNPGDWVKNFSYGQLENGEFSLNFWDN